MNIGSLIRNNFRLAAMTTLVVLSTPAYNHFSNHDVSEETEHKIVMRKMDGWYASSQMTIYLGNNSVVIDKYELWNGHKRLSDGNHDGNLDNVDIELPFLRTFDFSTRFDYGFHVETPPEVLEKENKVYGKNLREFIELYDEEYGERFEDLGLLE